MTGKGRNDLRGRVLRLADLVHYQPGAVSSRMIVNNPAGSITLFSFDQGEGISDHAAPFDSVVTILDGEAGVWIGGTTHAMTVNQTIVVPANVPHAFSATTPFKMALVMIRG